MGKYRLGSIGRCPCFAVMTISVGSKRPVSFRSFILPMEASTSSISWVNSSLARSKRDIEPAFNFRSEKELPLLRLENSGANAGSPQ
jgi:hypothetical protein